MTESGTGAGDERLPLTAGKPTSAAPIVRLTANSQTGTRRVDREATGGAGFRAGEVTATAERARAGAADAVTGGRAPGDAAIDSDEAETRLASLRGTLRSSGSNWRSGSSPRGGSDDRRSWLPGGKRRMGGCIVSLTSAHNGTRVYCRYRISRRRSKAHSTGRVSVGSFTVAVDALKSAERKSYCAETAACTSKQQTLFRRRSRMVTQ
jgi:hypothetical protein